MCSHKIFISTPWRVVGHSESEGLLRPKFLKESVKQNWTFQIRGWWGGSGSGGGGGGGDKSPQNSDGGVWIFAGTTIAWVAASPPTRLNPLYSSIQKA